MIEKLTIKLIKGEAVDKYWDECTRLSLKMCFPSYFCSGEWLSAAYKTILPNEKVIMLVVESKFKIVGLLPLVQETNIINVKVLRYLGYNFYPDPIGVICSCKDRKRVVKKIKQYLLNSDIWDLLEIKFISKNEFIDWHLEGDILTLSPFLKLPHNIEDLLSEFKRKKRYNLNSSVNKLIKHGGQLVIANSRKKRLDMLNELFILHKTRAAERSIKSSFDGSRVETLHKILSSDSDYARFYGIRIDEQLIAILYGFEFNNQFFYYQIAHNPKYGNLSPGTVLLYYVIMDCCEKGINQFNFLQGNESYKEFWTSKKMELYALTLINSTYRGRLVGYVRGAKTVLKKLIQSVLREQ